jgi:hypothetical protein
VALGTFHQSGSAVLSPCKNFIGVQKSALSNRIKNIETPC